MIAFGVDGLQLLLVSDLYLRTRSFPDAVCNVRPSTASALSPRLLQVLNEKLAECFELLDQIQRTYRNYNDEYIEIVKNYPNKMDTFFEEFEEGLLAVFELYPEAQCERIQEL